MYQAYGHCSCLILVFYFVSNHFDSGGIQENMHVVSVLPRMSRHLMFACRKAVPWSPFVCWSCNCDSLGRRWSNGPTYGKGQRQCKDSAHCHEYHKPRSVFVAGADRVGNCWQGPPIYLVALISVHLDLVSGQKNCLAGSNIWMHTLHNVCHALRLQW